ncbi:polyprotein [Gossypium australe]|uniref:Polyprotein n=1 Tax=Gossypium australe TaxID=47621 RepID=A0A5B6VZF3_9ROSI|nr:polyprotein [Gossypium australe]
MWIERTYGERLSSSRRGGTNYGPKLNPKSKNGLVASERLRVINIIATNANHTKDRQPSIIYVVRGHEDRDAFDVITCIHSVPYFALIDIGSTHLYIACNMFDKLGVGVEETTIDVTAISPLGQLIIEMSIGDSRGSVSSGFYGVTIWGLVEHQISLDYASKRVTLKMLKGSKIVMIGEQQNYVSNVIFAMVVEKLVCKGCEAYLAYVMDENVISSILDNIQIVKEFSYVFPEELLRLPLDSEGEFRIELFLGIAPVSIVP